MGILDRLNGVLRRSLHIGVISRFSGLNRDGAHLFKGQSSCGGVNIRHIRTVQNGVGYRAGTLTAYSYVGECFTNPLIFRIGIGKSKTGRLYLIKNDLVTRYHRQREGLIGHAIVIPIKYVLGLNTIAFGGIIA